MCDIIVIEESIVTREREDALLAQLNQLQLQAEAIIQRIVDARQRGSRDDQAIADLAQISHQRREITRPVFDQAAA
jgi:hypothetical protein